MPQNDAYGADALKRDGAEVYAYLELKQVSFRKWTYFYGRLLDRLVLHACSAKSSMQQL